MPRSKYGDEVQEKKIKLEENLKEEYQEYFESINVKREDLDLSKICIREILAGWKGAIASEQSDHASADLEKKKAAVRRCEHNMYVLLLGAVYPCLTILSLRELSQLS